MAKIRNAEPLQFAETAGAGGQNVAVSGAEIGGLARGPAFQSFNAASGLQATQFALNADFRGISSVAGNFDADGDEELLIGGNEILGAARGPAYQLFDTNGSLLSTKFVLNSDFINLSFHPFNVGTNGVLACGRESSGLGRGPAYQVFDASGNLVRTQFVLNTDFGTDFDCVGANLDGTAADEVIVFGREVAGATRGPTIQVFNSDGSLKFTRFVLNKDFTENKFTVGDPSSTGIIVYGRELTGSLRGPAFQTFDVNGNLALTRFILNNDFTDIKVFSANTDGTIAGDEIVTGGMETGGLALRGPAIQVWDNAGNHQFTQFVLNESFTEVTFHKIDVDNNGIDEILAVGRETSGPARGPAFQLFDGSGNLLLTRFVLNSDFTDLKFFTVDVTGDGKPEIGVAGVETTGAARGPAYQIFGSNGDLLQTVFVLNSDF